MNEMQLKKLHNVMQEALDEIDRVSGLLDTKYYLIGGTLLGAVRHSGFIPWDDDLDVAMPRDDYNRFLKEAPHLLSNRFFLQSRKTDQNYGNMFSKILVKNTAFDQSINKESNQKTGIFVDIFPLDDGYPDPKGLKAIRIKIAKTITSYLFQKRNGIELGKLRILNVFSTFSLLRAEESLYKGHGEYYVNYGSQYGIKKQTIKKTDYDPPERLEFEGKMYYVPHNYKIVLEKIYGKNYMQLPPVEKRVTHNPIRLSFDTTGPDESF